MIPALVGMALGLVTGVLIGRAIVQAGHAAHFEAVDRVLAETDKALSKAVAQAEARRDVDAGFQEFARAQIAGGADYVAAVVVRPSPTAGRTYLVRRASRPGQDVPGELIVAAMSRHYQRTTTPVAEA